MNLTEIIQSRRSIFPKSYDPNGEISKELLLQILENANAAPSHKITEPFCCEIFQGESRKKLADFMLADYLQNTAAAQQVEMKKQKIQESPLQSAVVIVLKMKRHPDLLPEWEEIASVAMAVQNMWLTCTDLGIGSYWSSPDSIVKRGGNLLKLAANEQCLGLFYMGYPKPNLNFTAPKLTAITDKIIWHN